MLSNTTMLAIILFCSSPNTGYEGPRTCIQQATTCTMFTLYGYNGPRGYTDEQSEALMNCLTRGVPTNPKAPKVRK